MPVHLSLHMHAVPVHTEHPSCVLDSGFSVEKFTSMLAGLTLAESKKWMNEHSVIANLAPGIAVWVPYGYLAWLLSNSDQAFTWLRQRSTPHWLREKSSGLTSRTMANGKN